MKRICLLGAAIAGVLVLGVASALAATTGTSKTKTTKSAPGTKVACVAALSLQVPSNDTNVTPAAQSGTEGGAVACAKLLGRGIDTMTYAMADSGDLVGKWQQWFNTGTVYGTFTLTPSSNQPSTSQSFSAAGYTGTYAVKGGTSTDAKAADKGTLKCATTDSVHFVCKQSGKLSLPRG
ncbi:MAG TPA: hypothetical protein VG325_00175 [Solirubrobacteraceae bacterium]|nr:hypothetical protein [Solirubrobacteraceae bacterium]